MKIAFIGLGIMGGHMARHLASAYDLAVFDVDKARLSAMSQTSARLATSVQDAATGADVVMLSLPSSEIVQTVVLGSEGAANVMAEGATLIDTSTTAPEVSRAIAKELADLGIGFLDAPVSGGEGGARDASLAIMAGGPQDLFDACEPILATIGSSTTRVGGVGAGGVAKLVNNMIVGSTFAVIAEGFALGRECGLDAEDLYNAIRGGWAGSKVMEVAAPGIIKEDFVPGGSIDILFKDIGYALALARSNNVPTPMTALVDEIFKAARATGRGPQAQQVIIKLWEDLGIGRSQTEKA